MKISVSDYLFQKIEGYGTHDIFMVSGGGIMYLCDALGRNKSLRYWCNYHEQACAIAAESYARLTNRMGVCLVTTGPGGTNALTGVAGCYVDSIPILVISGQVRTGVIADYAIQRQVGPQEINIIPMATPITKYAVTVMKATDIRYELEKCIHLATTGRPGPVWIDIPLDIQSALIDPDECRGFVRERNQASVLQDAVIDKIAGMLRAAKRPVIIGGAGIALSGGRDAFRNLVEKLSIPALASFTAMDILEEDHPYFQGRFGPSGQRRANFALQNSDFVLAIGTGLSISSIGFSDNFAPRAFKILVNIDPGDLIKKNIKIEMPVLADAKEFIERLGARFAVNDYAPSARWLKACSEWKHKYPPMPSEELLIKDPVDVYSFFDELSNQMGSSDIIVTGNSLDGSVMTLQNHRLKKGQRAFTNVYFGPMGWDLPALVGACVAAPKQRVVLVTGDGSVLFNIQELMSIGQHKMNAKIFISNNNGYQCIRITGDRWFEGRQVGADAYSGVANPDFKLLAAAFGINYLCIKTSNELPQSIKQVFSDDKPWLVEYLVSQEQKRFRISSYRKEDGTLASRPLEDMDPLLPREELQAIMTMFDDEGE